MQIANAVFKCAALGVRSRGLGLQRNQFSPPRPAWTAKHCGSGPASLARGYLSHVPMGGGAFAVSRAPTRISAILRAPSLSLYKNVSDQSAYTSRRVLSVPAIGRIRFSELHRHPRPPAVSATTNGQFRDDGARDRWRAPAVLALTSNGERQLRGQPPSIL